MRKSNAMKSVMNRIENLAKKEYRDIVGQLEAMLSVYEKTTGVSSKRPYTRKELATTEAKPPEKKVVAKSDRPAFQLVSPQIPKQRKVRKDKGQKRAAYTKRTPSEKMLNAYKSRKPLTAQQKKNISMGRKLALARKKLESAGITL
jgi:hypothetical protein